MRYITLHMGTIKDKDNVIRPKYRLEDFGIPRNAYRRHYQLKWYGIKEPWPDEYYKTFDEMTGWQKVWATILYVLFGKRRYLRDDAVAPVVLCDVVVKVDDDNIRAKVEKMAEEHNDITLIRGNRYNDF